VCDQEGNQPAIVQGPSDRTVEGGDRVRLTGSGYDLDRSTSEQGFTGVGFSRTVLDGGGVLTTSRLTVTHGDGSSTASFTAPTFSKNTTLVLRFSAFDPLGCGAHDQVRIFVRSSNNKPGANAGRDQEVMETEQVTLYGSGTDPDGDRLTYRWSQLSGLSVELLQGAGGQNHFVAPRVQQRTELEFRLVVDDGNGGEDSDEVQITVKDNCPPRVGSTPAPDGGPRRDGDVGRLRPGSGRGCAQLCLEPTTGSSRRTVAQRRPARVLYRSRGWTGRRVGL